MTTVILIAIILLSVFGGYGMLIYGLYSMYKTVKELKQKVEILSDQPEEDGIDESEVRRGIYSLLSGKHIFIAKTDDAYELAVKIKEGYLKKKINILSKCIVIKDEGDQIEILIDPSKYPI